MAYKKDPSAVDEIVGKPPARIATQSVADEPAPPRTTRSKVPHKMTQAVRGSEEPSGSRRDKAESFDIAHPDSIGAQDKKTLESPQGKQEALLEEKVEVVLEPPQESPRPHRYSNGDRENGYGGARNSMHADTNGPTEQVKGYLDIQPEGHGFLRPKFIPSPRDIYISQSQIRRFLLRGGDMVEGLARPPKDTERYYGLLKVENVNEVAAEESMKRPHFDDLTPIYPKQQLILTTGARPLSTRIIDLAAPIGFGQRGMIVSPPKAGKTTIMKEIAAGISQNFPNAHLMAALIGERPEEVTDIQMSVRGDVVASNFDEPPENQTRVAEITLERAKRLVEMGKDVIILLDSITRLARAYNLSVAPSGRTLSGGFDPAALWPAKRFFGAARNCQEGGSLTIIGTALVDTGSRMDDLIYEEFKGTGNMELHLDRKLAERRIYPAINIERSGTRQEELILPEEKLKKVVTMRRMIDMLNADERTAIIVERLSKTETNEEFLENLGKA